MICEMCGGSGQNPHASTAGEFCTACDGRGRVGGYEPTCDCEGCDGLDLERLESHCLGEAFQGAGVCPHLAERLKRDNLADPQ